MQAERNYRNFNFRRVSLRDRAKGLAWKLKENGCALVLKVLGRKRGVRSDETVTRVE